jgi:DNA-binding response OmpR family regulator
VRLFYFTPSATGTLSHEVCIARRVSLIQRQILVVDDDPSIRNLLRLVAERRGLSVDMAADGAEALQLLAERRYALAIVDLMMPRVNGYELVTAIRSFTQRPAVVIATAMSDSLVGLLDADIVHTIIRKPFDIEMVGSLMAAVVAENKEFAKDLRVEGHAADGPPVPGARIDPGIEQLAEVRHLQEKMAVPDAVHGDGEEQQGQHAEEDR